MSFLDTDQSARLGRAGPAASVPPQRALGAAFAAALCLGRLPRRAARAAYLDFDLSETRTYGGGADAPATGAALAGMAAHIVRYSYFRSAFMNALRLVPASMVGPLKVYLRVKIALGRLRAEIGQAPPRPSPAVSAPAAPPASVSIGGAVPEPRPPAFRWDISPAKAYGFAGIEAAQGYDPRGTSADWIEARAARLRRKWARYNRAARGEPERPKPARAASLPAGEGPSAPPDADPVPVRHFVPADVRYDEVWPPVALPPSPPKMEPIKREPPKCEDAPAPPNMDAAPRPTPKRRQDPTSELIHAALDAAPGPAGDAAPVRKAAFKRPAALTPHAEIMALAQFGRAATGSEEESAEDGEGEGEDRYTDYPAQPARGDAAVMRALAKDARAQADAGGNGLQIPAEYLLRFGMDAPNKPERKPPKP